MPATQPVPTSKPNTLYHFTRHGNSIILHQVMIHLEQGATADCQRNKTPLSRLDNANQGPRGRSAGMFPPCQAESSEGASCQGFVLYSCGCNISDWQNIGKSKPTRVIRSHAWLSWLAVQVRHWDLVPCRSGLDRRQ
jgi:hypothetical protein